MNGEQLKNREGTEMMDENAPGEQITLFHGVVLSYHSFDKEPFSIQHRHNAMESVMQVNYCRGGQLEWKMGNGQCIYLNPGDFSLHTMNSCADSVVSFPTGQYSGLTICIDLREISLRPPELLKDTDILNGMLREKFCPDGAISFVAGNAQTESIFSAFYGQPEYLSLPYRKIKALELLLYLAGLDFTPQKQLTGYQAEQIEIIREIHDRLTGRMNERITIGELSRQYLINPTTLKTAFKAVYGSSIAAHMKEHRMEQAAKMLRESDASIAKVAQAVGYDSQSRFTAAFKAVFHVLPREYRKKYK